MRGNPSIASALGLSILFMLVLIASPPPLPFSDSQFASIPNSSQATSWIQSAQNLGLSFESTDTTYHRILALYFLGGLNQLAQSNKTFLLNYISSTYNSTAGGYGNWPRSAPSIESTYQSIQVLRVLNSLPTSNATKIAQFLGGLQQVDGGFKALASSAASDVGSTYRVIHTLLILRGNTNDINLATALTFLTNSQNSDGGFGQRLGNQSQLVFTFRAVYAYNLTANTPPNLSKIISYVKSLQQNDNGWSDIPTGRTTVGHTYDAVHSLDILNTIQPSSLDATTASKATSFITQSQVALSGFGTHPTTKVPEFTSTHFASQALQILKRYTTVSFDVNSAIRFALVGPPLDGGFANVPGSTTNVPATFYASLGLHYLGSTPLNSTLAIAFTKDSFVLRQGGFGFRPGSGATVTNTFFGIQTLRFYGAQRNWTGVINFLQSTQNPDGGFGASPGNVSTVLSTLYATLALRELNSQPANGAGAINYLLSAHNSNGGFGIHPGAPSDMESTMQGVLALQALSQALSSVSNALTFTANSRNADGGYGFNPANVSRVDFTHDALLIYVTFRTLMPNNATTRSFILSLQNADGGFGLQKGHTSDIKSTYEALDALTLFGMISSGTWTMDLFAPVIERLLAPAIAAPGVIPLSARVTDNETGVANVTLRYSTDAVNFQSQTLPSNSGNTYQWSIGPYSAGTLVTYQIVAYDHAGNRASTTLHTIRVQSLTPTLGFSYPPLILLGLVMLAMMTGVLVLSSRVRRKKESR